MKADKVILSSMMVTLASTMGASVLPTKYGGKGALPSPRLLIGTGLTYFGLSIMGDLAPAVAGPLAAAIGVTAVTYYGFPLLDNWFNDKTTATTRTPVGGNTP